MEAFRKIYPSEFYKKFLVQDVRPDGRGLNKIRKTTVSGGSITTAHGSSFTKIGNTSVMCGIKAEIGHPPPPGNPQLVVNIELLPLCSPNFKPGKPSDQAQTVGQMLNDLARNVLNPMGLTVETDKGPVAWYLYADLYCMDYDGNIFDTALIGLLAALKNVRLPNLQLTESGEVLASEDRPHCLTLSHVPVALTFAMIDEYVVVDPTAEEESLQNGSIVVVFDEVGTLCSFLKPGGAGLTDQQVDGCMQLARQRTKDIVQMLNKQAK